jgi:hypothetical protein
MNSRNAEVFWYPPVVPVTTKSSSKDASAAAVGGAGAGGLGFAGSGPGFSPLPNAMPANTAVWAASGRAGDVFGTTCTIHSTSAVLGG